VKYIVDTSAILAGAEYGLYEKKYFTPYWDNFDKKVQEGLIASTEQVYNELVAKDDKINEWAEKNKKMFLKPSPKIFQVAAKLHKKFPNWYDKNKEKKNWADSQVIAFAKYHNAILVTQEGWNWKAQSDRKYKIPTICSKSGAYCHIGEKFDPEIKKYDGFQCIDFLELIKRENLHEIK
jgi:hypothetical protein